MNGWLQDVRFALRLLGRSPGFTAVAVLILGLGLGANVTVFSWVKGLILEPLPGVPDQQRIGVLSCLSRNGQDLSLSLPDLRSAQALEGPFSVVAFDVKPMNLKAGEQPERVWGSLVSGNFFDVLGVGAATGRTFRTDEDSALLRHPVVVLSYRFWERRFDKDPGIVGQSVTLNGHPFTIVGVAARDFQGASGGFSMDLWLPLAMHPWVYGFDMSNERGTYWLDARVRLRSGATPGQAQAAFDTLSTQLARAYPGSNEGKRLVFFRFWNAPSGPSKSLLPALTILGAMVFLVLLIACANVANLLLVRALGRRREIAMRLAIGAGRRRLIRQMLTESILLALLAGAVGVLIARWATRLLALVIPPTDIPVAPVFSIDGGVLLFAAALSLLTAFFFSLAPAFQITSPGISDTLRDESGTVSTGGRKGLLRNALVVVQIALSVVLLVSAGLFVRSLGRASQMDPGFDTHNVLLGAVDLFSSGYDENRGKVFFRETLRRLKELPGVESVSLARQVPLTFGGSNMAGLRIGGYEPQPDEEIIVPYNSVGPDYLKTMRIPLLSGRDFSLRDDDRGAQVMIINETMARRYWGERDPVGSRVRIWESDATIVGVAGDSKYQNLNEPPQPHFYVPILQFYPGDAVIHVRTAEDPVRLAPAVRNVVRQVDPNLPLVGVRSLEEASRVATFVQRLAATFLGLFGLIALLLATVGLSSLVRYAVRQRQRELGVRLALGAEPAVLARMVVGQGLLLNLLGVAAGLTAAFGVTRFLRSQLLGVSVTDPAVFLAVPLLLTVVTALACYLPAREAAGVDPGVTLRAE
jgi:macrolide transport system ATP-binding/permease protein